MAIAIEKKTEFRSFGEGTPVYQVIEVKENSVKILVLDSSEIVENYPLEDYNNDPVI